MTHQDELDRLIDDLRRAGRIVVVNYNRQGHIDGIEVDGRGELDPLSFAEKYRGSIWVSKKPA